MTPVTLHIKREGTTIGQFPLDTAQQCLDSGIILPSDLCWHEGMSKWKPVSEVLSTTALPPILDAPPPPPSDYVPPPLQGTPPAVPTYTTTGVDTVPGAAAPSQKTSFDWKNFAFWAGVLLCGILAVIGQFTPDTDTFSPHSPTSSPEPVVEEKWFAGGTLHDATIAEWNKATYDNQLATASDWLTSTLWKGHLNSPRDFDRLKIKASMLVAAVTEAGEPAPSLKAIQVAAAITLLPNDLGPD